jgi:hypothetical protein
MTKHYVELEGGMIIQTKNLSTWPNAKVLTKREGEIGIKLYAAKCLFETLKAGDRVYTVLRNVSSSGMTRHIDLYVFRDERPVYLTGLVANLLGEKRAKDNSISVSGCGTDMGFELVYRLAQAMFPNGLEDQKDGGFVLKHAWL